jgi:serine/threonine protein kinase
MSQDEHPFKKLSDDVGTMHESPAEKSVGLQPGDLISGKYRILELIGTGGMGSVYKALQVFLDRQFAVKVLDLHHRSDLIVRRFHLEARTASQLRHPNLIAVNDFGLIDDNQPYLVMELLNGVTLEKYLRKTGPLPVDYVVALAVQLIFGLIYAHENGVVHRDIKPANIMLLNPEQKPEEGSVKIVDFGIAKLVQSEDGEIQALTRTGEIFGSPLYMSPEQCKGSAVDRRSDIYSLGCVLFECLTGSQPFYGETAMITMVMKLSQEPSSLKKASGGKDFPELLEAVIKRMLATNPLERYQDLAAVFKDLVRLQHDQQQGVIGRLPISKKSNQRSRFFYLIGCTALVSCLATAAVDHFYLLKKHNEVSYRPPIKSLSLDEPQVMEGSKYPTVEIITNMRGETFQRFHFPKNIGSLVVSKDERRPAQGDVILPINRHLDLRVDNEAAQDPQLLSNLTQVEFGHIDYGGNSFLKDESIAILEKIKYLKHVRISGPALRSLKPFYGAAHLVSLEICDTGIPISEIPKLNGLPKLEKFSFGPTIDSTDAIKALTKFKHLLQLQYKGPSFADKEADRRREDLELDADGLKEMAKLRSVKSLHIVNCSKFDDEALKKLLPLQLEKLEITDCGVTAKSLPTLLRWKNLVDLDLTSSGWTNQQQQALELAFQAQDRALGKAQACTITFTGPRVLRHHVNADLYTDVGRSLFKD